MPAPTFLDPAALMRIRSLELRARTVVEGFWRGLHRSPFHGFSSEFSEYRPYVQGDDPRHLDWKLLARSDRACTRKFEAETNVSCHFLLDASASMRYGSAGHTKLDYARTLIASLGVFLHEQGDAIGLITFADRVIEHLPAKRSGRRRHELLAALERCNAGATTSIETSLEHLIRTQTRRGIIILVSDLLAPIDAIEPRLQALTACGHDVSILQVLDRAEIDFPFAEPAQFEDLETGSRLHVEPAAARARYLERLRQHQARVQSLCTASGALFHTFASDEPLERALFDHLTDRSRRRRGVRRARQLR